MPGASLLGVFRLPTASAPRPGSARGYEPARLPSVPNRSGGVVPRRRPEHRSLLTGKPPSPPRPAQLSGVLCVDSLTLSPAAGGGSSPRCRLSAARAAFLICRDACAWDGGKAPASAVASAIRQRKRRCLSAAGDSGRRRRAPLRRLVWYSGTARRGRHARRQPLIFTHKTKRGHAATHQPRRRGHAALPGNLREAEGLRLQRNAAPASAHSPALTPRTRAPLESLYGPYVKRLRSDAVACYRWAPHPAQAEPVLRAAGQSSSTPRMVPTAGKRRC